MPKKYKVTLTGQERQRLQQMRSRLHKETLTPLPGKNNVPLYGP